MGELRVVGFGDVPDAVKEAAEGIINSFGEDLGYLYLDEYGANKLVLGSWTSRKMLEVTIDYDGSVMFYGNGCIEKAYQAAELGLA